MNNQAFSKIWILVIIVILVGGGILTWQFRQEPKVGSQEEGKGVAEESKIIEEEFSIEEENLPSVDTSNWEIREHRYNYSFKYPGDTYKWKYLAGTCEDLQEINPQQKCKEVEYPDSAVRSDLLLAKKEEYKVPEWYPTESIYKDFFVYQAPIMSIGVYSNSAKLGLADLCEKYYEADCCSKEPNYTIGGVPAIRCTKKYITLTKLEENLDWLSTESRKWLEEKGYKPGDFVKTDLVGIRDLVIVLFGGYRYQVVSNSYLQERDERAIFEGILFTFRFLESAFISPKGMEQWKIGETHTVEISQPVEEFSPFTHLTLNKPDGEEVGIISCKIGGLGKTAFDWNTKSVLNYCGAGLEGKIKEVKPGTYMVAITKDVEGRPIMASSEQFSITSD